MVLYCVHLAATWVRLLSLARAFIDCVRLIQPRAYFNPPTIFISNFPPHLHLHRLRGLLEWPRRMTTASFARANSRPPVHPFTPWHPRSPQAKQVVGGPQTSRPEPKPFFSDSTSTTPPPPSENMAPLPTALRTPAHRQRDSGSCTSVI